jgi:hypothetical protein
VSGGTLLFLIIGIAAMLVGVGMMIVGIRGGPGTNPRSTVLLIAGMMATAFGMLLTAFAIGSSTGATLELNSQGAR